MDFLKDSKRLSVSTVVRAIAMATIAVCAVLPGVDGVEVQGIIRVFNVLGENVTMSNCRDFMGRSKPAGSFVIASMKGIEWRFRGYQTTNRAWTCQFQWTDAADCGPATAAATGGRRCRVHGRDVSLWQPACVDCVWRMHHEGFYRRDGRVQPPNWQFMFGWEY